MHRKRVTSELHDSYFRWMTISHAIPKIELAIKWAWNYYITQSGQKSRDSCSYSWRRSYRRFEVGKATPGRGALGNPDGVWGPEKLLIRCSKESQYPAEWTPGPPVEHQENEKDTMLTAIRVGVKILQFMFVLQLPLTRKPWVTLFEPLQ